MDRNAVYPNFIGSCDLFPRINCCLALLLMALAIPATARSQTVPDSPLVAEETIGQFELHPDCRIELVAAEPDVVDPVAIAFAPDGKLWVVEYSDYPNGPPENGPPLSRLRTLTDADGDGRFTDAVTFADKLLFANGLMLWQDGVIITTDGAVVFMRDTDGDGRADEQTEWFKGFKRENPQLRANHPTLGLDGHIYVASGLRGGEVIAAREDWAKDAKPVSLSGRDFRFDPFTGEYESVSGPGQFGLCFDAFGNRFVCSNRNPCNHIVLEDRYLARNPFLAVSQVHEDVSPAAEKSHLYPISRTWTTSNLHANQFTAACGVLIYGGDGLPQFRGNSFTCEPTANLVHRDVLEPSGATFASHYGREGVEFLATRDEWFRPVNLTHGPDGALYVVDMYRAVIEHPQFMPEELKTRPDLTLGNDRGRIYRIVNTKPAQPDHDATFRTEPELLVKHLQSPNAWHRDTAFRLLLEQRHPLSNLQQDRTLDAQIQNIVTASPASEAKVAAVALLGAIAPDISGNEFVDDPRVTEQRVRIQESGFAGDARFGDRLLELLDHPTTDDRLRFQIVLSLGAVPHNAAIVEAIAGVAFTHADDRWFRAAVGSSSAEVEGPVLVGVLKRWRSSVEDKDSHAATPPLALVSEFARMVGSRGDEQGALSALEVLSEPLKSQDIESVAAWQRTQFVAVAALAEGARRGKLSLTTIMGAPGVDIITDSARKWVTDSKQPADLRQQAMEVAAIDPSAEATDVLAQAVATENDQGIVVAAIEALSRKSDERVADVLLDGFKSRTPSVRSAILNALLARTDRTTRLLDEIEAGNLSPRDVDAASAARLTKSRDAGIKTRAAKLLASANDADRAKVLATYTLCLKLAGDPRRGLELFKKTCATCHKVGSTGTNVGPDISDSRVKTPEFLLTNILDPNRAVDGNFFGYTILDTEGRVFTGIITNETASSVTLRLQEGKDMTLLRQDIDEMVNTGLSLMPNGLEKNISVEQMADLISFIKNWRYLDGSVPEEVIR